MNTSTVYNKEIDEIYNRRWEIRRLQAENRKQMVEVIVGIVKNNNGKLTEDDFKDAEENFEITYRRTYGEINDYCEVHEINLITINGKETFSIVCDENNNYVEDMMDYETVQMIFGYLVSLNRAN